MLKALVERMKPQPTEETKQEICLVFFFMVFGAGLWLFAPALSLTICGLLGMLFFYPRKGR